MGGMGEITLNPGLPLFKKYLKVLTLGQAAVVPTFNPSPEFQEKSMLMHTLNISCLS